MNLLKEIKHFADEATGNSSSGPAEDWYITAERGEGLKDKDEFSKSDPYLQIHFGGKKVRTRTINNDRSPAWNETFHFKLNSGNAGDITLQLLDDDIGFDDSIGKATVSREDLPSRSGEEKYLQVPVMRKDQVGGIIHLKVKKMVEGSNQSSFSNQTSQSSQYNQQQQQQPQYQQSSFQQQQQQPQYQQSSFQQQQQQPQYQQDQQQQRQSQFNSNSNYYGQQ